MDDSRRALKIKKKHERQWLSIDGVTAIGLGKDNNGTAIIVSYCTNPEGIKMAIPASVDRIPVVFKFSGTINAQNDPFSL